jgi:predicted  nucleic acid-binding Zn-ribbon protein
VSRLEIYRETHAEKLDRLTNQLERNNDNLEKFNLQLTTIKGDQRTTHTIAGIIGSVLGVVAERFWK